MNKRTFWHNVKRIFGGTYYDAKTDMTYWYLGEVRLWVECKCYKVKQYILLKYYSFMIWWLKRAHQHSKK